MATSQTSDNAKQLGKLVIADQELKANLVAAPDQETWINMVIQFGESKGIKVTTQELTEAIKAKVAERIDSGTAKEILLSTGLMRCTAATSPF